MIIYAAVSPHQFRLMHIDESLIRHLFEENELKPGYIPTKDGPINTYSQYLDAKRKGTLVPGNILQPIELVSAPTHLLKGPK